MSSRTLDYKIAPDMHNFAQAGLKQNPGLEMSAMNNSAQVARHNPVSAQNKPIQKKFQFGSSSVNICNPLKIRRRQEGNPSLGHRKGMPVNLHLHGRSVLDRGVSFAQNRRKPRSDMHSSAQFCTSGPPQPCFRAKQTHPEKIRFGSFAQNRRDRPKCSAHPWPRCPRLPSSP